MHTELSRFIGGCRHDTAFARAADRHRLAAQFRIVALFDRRVKGIHIDMDDLAAGLGRDSVV